MDQIQDYGYSNKNPWIYCVKNLTPDIPRRKYRLMNGKTVIGTLNLKRRLPTVKEYDRLIEAKKGELGMNKKSYASGDITPGQFDETRKVNERILKRLEDSREMRENLVERGQMARLDEGGFGGALEDGVDRTPPKT